MSIWNVQITTRELLPGTEANLVEYFLHSWEDVLKVLAVQSGDDLEYVIWKDDE